MSSSNVDAGISIAIYGHISASPAQFASMLGGKHHLELSPEADVAIFAINPSAGIDQRTIDLWREYDELQTPRLVVVSVLDGMEMDFDDAVLLANRLFDQLVTPYLVLHGENGTPIGLISLEDFSTRDYSTDPPTDGVGDEELRELVGEFREEYFEQIAEMGEDAFAAGVLFPAIPVNPAINLGIDIVNFYLKQLPVRS